MLTTDSAWLLLDPRADPLRPVIDAHLRRGNTDHVHGISNRVIGWDHRTVQIYDLFEGDTVRPGATWRPGGAFFSEVLHAAMVTTDVFGVIAQRELPGGSFRRDLDLVRIDANGNAHEAGTLDLPSLTTAFDVSLPWLLTADDDALRAIDLSHLDLPDERALIPLDLDGIPTHVLVDRGEVLLAGEEMIVLGSIEARVFLPLSLRPPSRN